MNTPEIKAFIHENRSLFWYPPEDKKEEISLDFTCARNNGLFRE